MNVSFLIISEAGKPIFARNPRSEEEIARQCSLIQAIRTAARTTFSTSVGGDTNDSTGLGDIQSLRSGKLLMVFWTVGYLTLVATSKDDTAANLYSSHATEAYLRLELEYLYAQLIFHATDQIQVILQHNPSFDFRTTLGSSGNKLLEGLLNSIDSSSSFHGSQPRQASVLLGGIPMAFRLSYDLRRQVSQGLQSMGGTKANENLAFALLLVRNRIISLVQPSHRPHHLKASDVQLILTLLETHGGNNSSSNSATTSGSTSELWLPMCLPRFNSSAFLYAYIHCWDLESQLTIVLLSSHNTTEEFQRLRLGSQLLRAKLGIPAPASDRTLNVPNPATPVGKGALPSSSSLLSPLTGHDVSWTREESFDEDYVQIPSQSDAAIPPSEPSAKSLPRSADTEIPSLLEEVRKMPEKCTWAALLDKYHHGEPEQQPFASFRAQDPAERKQVPATPTSSGKNSSIEYSLQIVHWAIRLETPIKATGRFGPGSTKGHLAQCLTPGTWHPSLESKIAQDELWTTYQRLQLRLRLVSSTPEAIYDALDQVQQDANKVSAPSFATISHDCSTMSFVEAPARTQGASYLVDGEKLFLALNGKDYEVYLMIQTGATEQNETSFLPEAVNMATQLVCHIQADDKNLIMTNPLTWKD